MSESKRKIFTGSQKAKVALEAIKGNETLAELAEKYDVHPNQVTSWKSELLEKATEIFGKGVTESSADRQRIVPREHVQRRSPKRSAAEKLRRTSTGTSNEYGLRPPQARRRRSPSSA